MTEEEQAKQLYEKWYFQVSYVDKDRYLTTEDENKFAKRFSIFEIDSIIKVLDEISLEESGTTKIDYGQSKWCRIKEVIKNL